MSANIDVLEAVERGGGAGRPGSARRSTATSCCVLSHSPPVRRQARCALASVFCACLTSSSRRIAQFLYALGRRKVAWSAATVSCVIFSKRSSEQGQVVGATCE